MNHDSHQTSVPPDLVNVLQSANRFVLTFHNQGDFAATNAAEQYLTERGFSFGRMERGSPRGILFGNFNIQKWHNLTRDDRERLHGLVVGAGRNGPIIITLSPTAPEEAHTAILLLSRATGADQ